MIVPPLFQIVRALNSIFQHWGISASKKWNTSGEPCTGAAIDSSEINNPGIKCDCSYDNASTCHITQLGHCQVTLRPNLMLRPLHPRKFVHCTLFGVIPDELWNLTFLTILYLSQNYLTGPLSASIGNLRMMQNMSVGLNALSGSFLRNLDSLLIYDFFSFGTSNFSGSLPSELGNLVNLEYLYFDSSGQSGEIPSTFANLQSLTIVWASDNELTGNTPDFIGKWSKLTELRISDISNGSSTSLEFIKDMKLLSTLVLRNNNISDFIPSNIGEYGSLTQLDLSFNNLSGQLPESLFNLSQLTYLFLGNNQLTGSLPLQKSTSLLNIDLSYNGLSGSIPSWVDEENLQFKLVSNSFTLDSSNSSVLPSGLNCLHQNFPCNRGSGIYYNFAIKCGGPQITSSDKIVFERDNGTLGPATYYVTETNRWAVSNVGLFSGSNPQYTSTSSSQFTNILDSELFQTARISAGSLRYYGLGLENGNYNLTLQFAETAIVNSNSWKSLGMRVFDVYIQILSPTVPNTAPNGKKNRTGLMVVLAVGVGFVCILSVFAVYYFVLRRKKPYESQDEVLLGMDARPYTFSYAELRNATEDFSPSNKLGEGGFGPVYKGTLSDGRVVAVKHYLYHPSKERIRVNRSLVYEYLENKSLDQALFGNGSLDLDWPTRYDICLGVARGLAYLHEESRVRIVHRDVKASNILLDYYLNPKISDFGLAKLYDDTMTHISTRVAGTTGYLAPEYAMRGHLTEKADVYSFWCCKSKF
ncbi:putative LRR receptor-like serine/threonine-protein kinase [Vitis vinifera]|uniref:non-specific serine/threonine protein kinase n=1 Tax=Vitis vinifera TaxID=29760 RepID=A0A438BXK3_VITVI|nr:putative LRR receptor-like serine/threonine-protein kinase [Vitis vinifera]